MTIIRALAGRLHELARGDWDDCVLAAARMRLFDHLCCTTEGATTDEAVNIATALAFARDHPPTLQDAIVLITGTVRSTEADDIHLKSLSTPGAVVVPVALVAATAARPSGDVTDRRLLRAIAGGYEAMARLGMGIDGPNAHYRGFWSTYFGAPFAAAATAAITFGLDTGEIEQALAIASVRSTGISVEAGAGPGSRWFNLGSAARDGFDSARAAAAGMVGDPRALETAVVRASSVEVDSSAFWADDATWQIRATDTKPFRTNRQSLAALESFMEVTRERSAGECRLVEAFVPEQVLTSVRRPGVPHDRWSPGLPYLIALAAYAPDALYDVHRTPVRDTPEIRDLAARVSVRADAALTSRYPSRWGGGVRVRWADGSVGRHEIPDADGSSARPYDWPRLLEKHRRICRASRPSKSTVSVAEAGWLDVLEPFCRGLAADEDGRDFVKIPAMVPGWPATRFSEPPPGT